MSQSSPDQHTSGQGPFGLLGRTLGHSWSPHIHAMLGSSPYSLFEREPDEVEDFVTNGTWQGINVTIPYKRDVVAYADHLTPRVKRLGVANTLVRTQDGSILADNTDILGFSWMIDRFSRRTFDAPAREVLAGRKVVVLGSGGASQAVCATLDDLNSKVVVISRTGNETYATLADRHGDATLLVNTTPVGMYPNCPTSPLDEQTLRQLPNLKGVLDVIYNPEHTELCLIANRLGIPAESGLAMLVSQAFFASELFLGKALDESVVQRIEQSIRQQTRNIVLIGMPGSGKTSAGRRLARLCGRPFVDLDDSFFVDHGMTPAECILNEGEDRFRERETQTAKDYACRTGLVISCGGGIVTRPQNYDVLKQNGTIVMLDRDLEELSTSNRPLSQSKGVEQLAHERMHLYKSWADIILPCTGSAPGDAVALKALLNL